MTDSTNAKFPLRLSADEPFFVPVPLDVGEYASKQEFAAKVAASVVMQGADSAHEMIDILINTLFECIGSMRLSGDTDRFIIHTIIGGLYARLAEFRKMQDSENFN